MTKVTNPHDPYFGDDITISGVSGFGSATYDPTSLPYIDLSQPPYNTPPYDPYNSLILPLRSEEVKGEMILVEHKIPPEEIYDESLMKKILTELLAEKLLQNKMVEFTKQVNLQTHEVVFRARAFVVPDDKVRQIRKTKDV